MTTHSYSVQPIGDALEDYISIAGEGLFSTDRNNWQTYVDRIGLENVRGVFDGARLAGGMAFYRMGQWFGGRELPCAGFSGVAVSPADRGTGACRKMLSSVLHEIRQDGIPLSSLYASSQYVYRSVGFEHAGCLTKYSIPISSITCEDRCLPIHRFVTPPIDKLDQVAEARATYTNGHLRRTAGLWQRLLNPYDGRGSTTYLFGDVAAPEGYAILRPGVIDGGVPQSLVSTDVAANTPRALRRLLTLVRDHRSMCDSFQWFGPPNDGLHFLADEQFIKVRDFMRWMLRIVDLPAALAGRGYDRSVSGELHLQIHDDLIPENSGPWILGVADGTAHVERGGKGSLAIDIRSLSPLYSSLYSLEELVRCGAIESGDESQIQLASQLFAGPTPWVPELY